VPETPVIVAIKYTEEGLRVFKGIEERFRRIQGQAEKITSTFSRTDFKKWKKDADVITKIRPSAELKEVFKSVGVDMVKSSKAIAGSSKDYKKGFLGMGLSMTEVLSKTLPLIFATQNLSKAMKSAIDPALDMVGANDLYQQMLAMKYLPTALKQLDNVLEMGDAWSAQSEQERTAEGDTALLVYQMSELLNYTAQGVNTFKALAGIIPEIDLAPLGIGIKLSGDNLASFLGITLNAVPAIATLRSETGQTVSIFGGFSQAVAITGTDALAAFTTKLFPATTATTSFRHAALNATTDTTTGFSGMSTDLSSIINTIIGKFTEIKSTLVGIGTKIGEDAKTSAISAGQGFVNKLASELGNISPIVSAFNIIGQKFEAFYNSIRSLPIVGGLFPEWKFTPITPTLGRGATGSFAEGGVVTRPTTALIGERGPEVVIPLDRIGSIGGVYITINTSTIGGNTDALAREISEKLSFELSRVRY
jgi:hypothetical protein